MIPPTPDPRVAQALAALGCGYEMSRAIPSLYRVTIRFPAEGRVQLVSITSQTWAWRGRDWRKVMSQACAVPGRLSHEWALRLLRDSSDQPFGGWFLIEQGGQTLAFFQAAVPAVATPSELQDAIALVSQVADDMEKSLTHADRH
jgi:hypothetical protein